MTIDPYRGMRRFPARTRLICAGVQMIWLTPPVLAGGPPVEFEDVSEIIDFPVLSFTVGGNGMVGAAWLDYDNDGWLDIYLTNGCNQDNGLFHNNRDGTFSDVSVQAGVAHGLGCNGVIAADINNDGFQDLFVTGEGGYQGDCARPVALYYNNGDGTFTDITASSGIVGPSTQFSAAMADINNDGFLDLFITGSGSQTGKGPANRMFLNNGDLTFLDISAVSGVDTDRGACATFFTDVNDDGLIDLFVANCVPFFPSSPIELFINNGDLSFTDAGVQAGLGAGGYWMGVAPGDYDNDGDIDMFVTNLGEGFSAWHALYRNNGDGTYTDVGLQAGVGMFEWGWGATMTDFDNDGYPDIFFAGADPAFMIGPGQGNPGTMLFNRGDGTFEDHTTDMPTNLSSRSTAGVAVGDYDNDGFMDIVVAVDAFGADPGGPTIFRNLGNANNWITIKLRGTVSNRDAVGARVRLTANGMTQTKEIYAGMSFLSQNSMWLTFGLGSSPETENIEIRWPSGLVETYDKPFAAGQVITLVEVDGELVADCTANNVPDICEIDCGEPGGECDVPGCGVASDCNGNGVPDRCEIDALSSAPGGPFFCTTGCAPDCNNNGLLDVCDPDCDANNIPDGCDIDCDANGITDACEFTPDCNDNGFADACDLAGVSFTTSSPRLSPFGGALPRSYELVGPPRADSDVTLTFEASADLADSSEFVVVAINGVQIGTVFGEGGHLCPSLPDTAQLTMSADAYNSFLVFGSAAIGMTASAPVDAAQCPESYIEVTVEYGVRSEDMNDNGVPDECEQCSDDGDCGPSDPCTIHRCIDRLCSSVSVSFGDVAGDQGECGPNDVVDLLDILAVLNGFQGIFANGCSVTNVDLAPNCTGDGQIDLGDILAVLDAFAGTDSCCAARR